MFVVTRDVMLGAIGELSKSIRISTTTRLLSYQESISLLSDITELLKKQSSPFIPSGTMPLGVPTQVNQTTLRQTLMTSTCVGTFTDYKLSTISLHNTVSNSTSDGLLSNISLDAITDMELCKKHLLVYLTHVYGLSVEHTKTVRIVINVSQSLADSVEHYLTPLLGHTTMLNNGRSDVILNTMKTRDVLSIHNVTLKT